MKTNVKHMSRVFACFCLVLFSSCAIHEWPSVEKQVPVVLTVKYNLAELDWVEYEYKEDAPDVGLKKQDSKINDEIVHGKLNYTVRMIPLLTKAGRDYSNYHEYKVTRDVAESQEFGIAMEVPPGVYDVAVWVDYLVGDTEESYYNTDDFAEIKLNGQHEGNNEYHDAFRGIGTVVLVGNIVDDNPIEVTVEMARPLARYELVTTDLAEFVANETARKGVDVEGGEDLNLDDYKVMVHYVGYYPDTYSIFTDKPVDSSTGVFFESTLKQLDANRASLGFDHAFVSESGSAVTVQMAIYDKDGSEVAATSPLEINLKRNCHSIMQGSFLMSRAPGGIQVNPEYEGDNNIIIP